MTDNSIVGKAVFAGQLVREITSTAKEVNAELVQILPKLTGVLEVLRRVQTSASTLERLLVQLNQL